MSMSNFKRTPLSNTICPPGSFDILLGFENAIIFCSKGHRSFAINANIPGPALNMSYDSPFFNFTVQLTGLSFLDLDLKPKRGKFSCPRSGVLFFRTSTIVSELL